MVEAVALSMRTVVSKYSSCQGNHLGNYINTIYYIYLMSYNTWNMHVEHASRNLVSKRHSSGTCARVVLSSFA